MTIIDSVGLSISRHQQRGQEGKPYERTDDDLWKTQRSPGDNCCGGGEKVGRELELGAKNIGLLVEGHQGSKC